RNRRKGGTKIPMNTPKSHSPQEDRDDFSTILLPSGEKQNRDERLFRRPENEEPPSPSEPEKDFPVEELLQWSAPPQPDPEEETPESSPVNEEETDENTPTAPQKLKLWQKIAAGVVVLALII